MVIYSVGACTKLFGGEGAKGACYSPAYHLDRLRSNTPTSAKPVSMSVLVPGSGAGESKMEQFDEHRDMLPPGTLLEVSAPPEAIKVTFPPGSSMLPKLEMDIVLAASVRLVP